MLNQEKTKKQIEFIRILAEAIRDAKRIPSGHLYAAVMGVASLEVYQACIEMIKRTGLVEEKNNELIWIG